MNVWFIRILEQAEKEYEELPEWKKRLWKREDFVKEREQNKIIPKRYDHNDWT